MAMNFGLWGAGPFSPFNALRGFFQPAHLPGHDDPQRQPQRQHPQRGPRRQARAQTPGHPDVQEIQKMLAEKLGPDALGPAKADGKYGPYTHRAMVALMQKVESTDPALAEKLKAAMEKINALGPQVQGNKVANAAFLDALGEIKKALGTQDAATTAATLGQHFDKAVPPANNQTPPDNQQNPNAPPPNTASPLVQHLQAKLFGDTDPKGIYNPATHAALVGALKNIDRSKLSPSDAKFLEQVGGVVDQLRAELDKGEKGNANALFNQAFNKPEVIDHLTKIRDANPKEAPQQQPQPPQNRTQNFTPMILPAGNNILSGPLSLPPSQQNLSQPNTLQRLQSLRQ